MNPGPVEEVGGTARSAIEALKTTPALLTIIISQIVMIGMLGWVSHERNVYEAGINQIFQEIIKNCRFQQRDGTNIPLPIPFPENVPRG